MKKFFTLIAVAGMFSFYACGPSAEEIAAKEKAKNDSIAKAAEEAAAVEAAKQQAMADSIAKVEAAALAEKAKADSIAAAEEAAKSKKPSGGGKPKVVVPKTVTAPGGRSGATKQ